MATARYIDEWRTAGIITPQQAAALTALVRKDRFSVFLELHTLLYLGAVAFATGLGWTVREHFANLGDLLILGGLGAIFAGSLFYCVTRATPYSTAQVPSPTFAFDYVLYVGCLAFAIALGYVEYRFELLRGNWDAYLLASSGLFFVFAYRFDNRFVLSLALSSLAGWFGVRLSAWHVLADSIRGVAIVYGVLVAGLGVWTHRVRIKAHFLEAYLHVAANAALIALMSGAMDRQAGWWWLAGLLCAAAAAALLGIRFKRFAFVVYGVVYGYVGVSKPIVDATHSDTGALTYFVVSGIAVVAGLIVTARRFGREP
jgi:predicted membrane protein DUF2157